MSVTVCYHQTLVSNVQSWNIGNFHSKNWDIPGIQMQKVRARQRAMGWSKDSLHWVNICSPEIHWLNIGWTSFSSRKYAICGSEQVPSCAIVNQQKTSLSAISAPRTWKAASNLSFRAQGLTTRDPLGFSAICNPWMMVDGWAYLSCSGLITQFDGMKSIKRAWHKCAANPRISIQDSMTILETCRNAGSFLRISLLRWDLFNFGLMDVSVSPSNPRYSCPTRTNCPCQGVTYIYSWRTTERQVPQHDHMRFEFGIDAAIFFDLPDNVVHSYIIAIVIQKK